MTRRQFSFLINASNLHTGGGVQVAVSLIDELSRMENLPTRLSILASNEVHTSLQNLNCDYSRFSDYAVFNTYGFSTLWSGLGLKLRSFDVVFTVFGPLYWWPMRPVNIAGFAQPWIIYPNNEIFNLMSCFVKFKIKLKYFVQSFFFKQADHLIVELPHVKTRLISRGFHRNSQIDVVHNCLSSIYFRPDQWRALTVEIQKKHFSIGFVGRDYPHKNTNILPYIKKVLADVHRLSVSIFVTLNSDEWTKKSEFFQKNINNAGVLDVTQCPVFYQQMDAVIFPSFLECFSATPLEALAMKKPLFASNRQFVRDVCGEFAWYFDPEDAYSAADLIADYINNFANRDDERLTAAQEHVIKFSNARQRAVDYLQIMQAAARGRAVV